LDIIPSGHRAPLPRSESVLEIREKQSMKKSAKSGEKRSATRIHKDASMREVGGGGDSMETGESGPIANQGNGAKTFYDQ